MTWQHLKYGTAVAAGLAVTGALVWFSDRPYIAARDVLEVVQGTQERCWNTQTVQGSNLLTSATNYTYTWAEDPRDFFWVTNAWDAASSNWVAYSNRYKLVTATNANPYSVTNLAGYSWEVDPMTWSNYFVSVEPTNRYIVSLVTNPVTSNVTVQSAMPAGTTLVYNAIDHYSSRDLHQLYTDKIRELVPVYVNHHMADTNGTFNLRTNETFPHHTLYEAPTSVWVYASCGTNIPVWMVSGGVSVVSNVYIFSDETNNSTISTNGGDVAFDVLDPTLVSWYTSKTNLGERADLLFQLQWTERTATVGWSHATTGGAVTVGANDIYDYLGTIPHTNEYRNYATEVSSNNWADAKSDTESTWFSQGFTSGPNDDEIYSFTRLWEGAGAWKYNGVIDALVQPITVTNTLGSTVALRVWSYNYFAEKFPTHNVILDDNGTGWTNELAYNNLASFFVEEWNDSTEKGTRNLPAWGNNPTNSSIDEYRGYRFYIEDRHLNDQKCIWTHKWRADSAANRYVFSGTSRHSWEEAKSLAEMNLIKGQWDTNEQDMVWGTSGTYDATDPDAPYWVAYIHQQMLEAVITGLNTNNSKTIDWYLRANPWDTVYLADDTTNAYYEAEDGTTIYYPTSFWLKVASTNYSAGTHTVTSPPICQVSRIQLPSDAYTNFPPWCVDPTNYLGTNTYADVARGFQGREIKAIIKWDNTYCTNDIP